jgi:hypothetical protein
LERASELLEQLENGPIEKVNVEVLEGFRRFVAVYSELYQYLDRVRTTAGEPKREARVAELLGRVRDAAGGVRAALVRR